MKKVIIFSASTGGGHNQAAASLEEEFKISGYEVIKIDALKETNKLVNSVITDGYKILYSNFPKIYGELYKLSNFKKFNNRITTILTVLIEEKMYEIIQYYNPDIIIATHAFVVNVVSELKQKKKINIPFMCIVTDFIAHKTYINNNVDAYITGSYYTKQKMIESGILEEKIFQYGIPINKEFLTKSINKKREKHDDFTILLMGGSMGNKSIENVLKKLVINTNKLKIITVCGNNEKLKSDIEKNTKENSNIKT